MLPPKTVSKVIFPHYDFQLIFRIARDIAKHLGQITMHYPVMIIIRARETINASTENAKGHRSHVCLVRVVMDIVAVSKQVTV